MATERGVFTSAGAEFQPLDPIGAGDAYAAGFLYGLLTTDEASVKPSLIERFWVMSGPVLLVPRAFSRDAQSVTALRPRPTFSSRSSTSTGTFSAAGPSPGPPDDRARPGPDSPPGCCDPG